jgi:two-component system response regulator
MKFDQPGAAAGAHATILLAEDSIDDVLLMKLAFKKAGLTNPVHVVATGTEAVEYLKGAIEAKSSGSPVPLLISLDIGMPMGTGFEVLNWIRMQPALDEVPVVVLSQSDEGKDANRAIQLGARSYLVKPASFDGLVGMIRIFKSLIDQVESRPYAAIVAPSRRGAARAASPRQGARKSPGHGHAGPGDHPVEIVAVNGTSRGTRTTQS